MYSKSLSLSNALVFLSCLQMTFAQSGGEAEMLKLINDIRAEAKLPPLCLDSKLSAAAKIHSVETTPQFPLLNHIGADGSTPGDRAKRTGATFTVITENLATKDSAKNAMERLMASPSHRQNILDPRVNSVGLAGTDGQTTVVQLFSQSEGKACENGEPFGKTDPNTPTPPLQKFDTSEGPGINSWDEKTALNNGKGGPLHEKDVGKDGKGDGKSGAAGKGDSKDKKSGGDPSVTGQLVKSPLEKHQEGNTTTFEIDHGVTDSVVIDAENQ